MFALEKTRIKKKKRTWKTVFWKPKPIDFIWWCKVTLQLAKKGRGETNLCNYSKEQQKDYTAYHHCCFHSLCVWDEGLNDDLTAFIKWMMWTTWMGWMTFIWYTFWEDGQIVHEWHQWHVKAKNTPVVRFMAIAAFDRAHQWPRRFTQMYWPNDRRVFCFN